MYQIHINFIKIIDTSQFQVSIYLSILTINYVQKMQNEIYYLKNLFNDYYLSLFMRKPAFRICENKDADQRAVTAKLISAFVFATRIVQSIYFLKPKFQACSHLQWLYSPVCKGLVGNPEDWFSHNEAHFMDIRYFLHSKSTVERGQI